jgi:Spy/CpxP family protein refolding chaperone
MMMSVTAAIATPAVAGIATGVAAADATIARSAASGAPGQDGDHHNNGHDRQHHIGLELGVGAHGTLSSVWNLQAQGMSR